jgi:excisionase family DNA binding protein
MKIELEKEDLRSISKEIMDDVRRVLASERTEHHDILFTVDSLAEYLQLSKQWIYERVHFKEIPYVKIGKFLRFKKSQIDKWLNGFAVPSTSLPSKLPQQRETY